MILLYWIGSFVFTLSDLKSLSLFHCGELLRMLDDHALSDMFECRY